MKIVSFQNDVLPLKNQLYRLALRITLNNQDAEDIVQETLIKIWNCRENWSKIESLEAYSLKICRNFALDLLRKKKPDTLAIEAVENNGTAENIGTSVTSDQILHRDKVNMVRNLINSLPEKQKTVLQLRDFEGKTYKEIALILGISEEQVKVNIFRARQTIKSKYEKLEEYGL